MTQGERDRPVALKKAKKKLITQREAAKELGISERHVRRLLPQSKPAHSPQAKGREERGFGTAQDRLVKGMRVAGVTTIKQANQYSAEEFAPWWNGTLIVQPAHPDNAHRPLDKHHDLAAILSHRETRRVANDYTMQFESKVYQIASKDVGAGLRGGDVRVEKRRDESIAVRFGERYLAVSRCELRPKQGTQKTRRTLGQ